MNTVFEKFQQKGGRFLINERLFLNRLDKIKLFIFDWDGVFTNGLKDAQLQSQFNESDSVGLNLLRFSYFLVNKKIPIVSIISGEKNQSAFTLAQREHIHRHYFKIPHKILAFQHLCQSFNVSPKECCFVFDDILDLSIAQECGLRMYIQKPSAVLFNDYVIKNLLADYISFSSGSNNAVREITELLIGAYDNFEEVIRHRIQYDDIYQTYLKQKKLVTTENYTYIDNTIQLVQL